MLADPFDGGRVLTGPDAELLVAGATGGPLEPSMLAPAGTLEVVARILNNVRAWAATRPERTDVGLWALDLALLLPSHPARLRYERAQLLVQRGEFTAGAAELEAYAEIVTAVDPEAADRIRGGPGGTRPAQLTPRGRHRAAVADGHLARQPAALEHRADAPGDDRLARARPEQGDRAAVGALQVEQQVERGGLPGPVRAEERHGLPGPQGGAHLVDGAHVALLLGHSVEDDRVVVVMRPSCRPGAGARQCRRS